MAVVTWNPADVSTGITLSNFNLDAKVGIAAGVYGVRATNPTSVGKWYFEATPALITVSGIQAIGLANATWPLNFVSLGTDFKSIGYRPDGSVWENNGIVATISSYLVNSIISVAFDLTNNKIWFRVNGGNWNNDVLLSQNPATNTGGVDISSLSGPFMAAWAGVTTNEILADFGFDFTYVAPVGFAALGSGEPITRLSLDGYGAKRIKDFDGKVPSTPPSTGVTPWPLFERMVA